MKDILMIAYHFPPVRVSSGIQRTLKFSQYLLSYNWRALVLTVKPMAYENICDDQMLEVPDKIVVKRAFSLDTARHLTLKGRYFYWMSLPDRWVSWVFGGVIAGLGLINKYQPKFIWSTYPIATAHLIALILHRISGIPWIADFRDSMTEENYPESPTKKKVYQWIEKKTVENCYRAVFTTPGASQMYAERYPNVPACKWAVIPNGYDEENFHRAEIKAINQLRIERKSQKQIVLLHSGILYPSERDPSIFFKALYELMGEGLVDLEGVKIVLRATAHDDLIKSLIIKFGIDNLVYIEPSVPYESALAEMLTVDGLIVFQGSNCNHQIPAKIYEYLRAKKPIFALTDPIGDTASVLMDAKINTISPLNDKDTIKNKFSEFLEGVRMRNAPIAKDECIRIHSREARTRLLADLLNGYTKKIN